MRVDEQPVHGVIPESRGEHAPSARSTRLPFSRRCPSSFHWANHTSWSSGWVWWAFSTMRQVTTPTPGNSWSGIDNLPGTAGADRSEEGASRVVLERVGSAHVAALGY